MEKGRGGKGERIREGTPPEEIKMQHQATIFGQSNNIDPYDFLASLWECSHSCNVKALLLFLA